MFIQDQFVIVQYLQMSPIPQTSFSCFGLFLIFLTANWLQSYYLTFYQGIQLHSYRARRDCCIKREQYFCHMHFSSYLDICLDLLQNCSFYLSIIFFLQPRVSMKIVFDKIIIHFWINFEKSGNYFPTYCTQVHRFTLFTHQVLLEY